MFERICGWTIGFDSIRLFAVLTTFTLAGIMMRLICFLTVTEAVGAVSEVGVDVGAAAAARFSFDGAFEIV